MLKYIKKNHLFSHFLTIKRRNLRKYVETYIMSYLMEKGGGINGSY